jgi:hypothetical protein
MDQYEEFDMMFKALDDGGRRYVLAVLRYELERIRRECQLSRASLHLQLVSNPEVVLSLPKSQIYPLTVVRTG